jgi:hypothetical protein
MSKVVEGGRLPPHSLGVRVVVDVVIGKGEEVIKVE